jgi:hypothetical protein
LVLDLEVVFVNITISVEVADGLGVLTFVAEHREGGGEHGCVFVSVTVGSVGGVDGRALVDWLSVPARTIAKRL